MTQGGEMTKQVDTPTWLTVAEVAAKLGISKMTVYRMVGTKEIKSYKFGRAYRINAADLEQYIADSEI